MSARDNDREWIERERVRFPEGWEARMVEEFGMHGTLDLLALQSWRPHEVNLTHRPFAGNEEAKALVRDAREAVSLAARWAFTEAWTRIHD